MAALTKKADRVRPCRLASASIASSNPASSEMRALTGRPLSRMSGRHHRTLLLAGALIGLKFVKRPSPRNRLAISHQHGCELTQSARGVCNGGIGCRAATVAAREVGETNAPDVLAAVENRKVVLAIVKNLAGGAKTRETSTSRCSSGGPLRRKPTRNRDAVLETSSPTRPSGTSRCGSASFRRLMRRYGATGQRKDLFGCAKCWNSLRQGTCRETDGRSRIRLRRRSLADLPAELVTAMTEGRRSFPDAQIAAGRSTAAVVDALKLIADEKARRHQTPAVPPNLRHHPAADVGPGAAQARPGEPQRRPPLRRSWRRCNLTRTEPSEPMSSPSTKTSPTRSAKSPRPSSPSRAAWSLFSSSALTPGKIDKRNDFRLDRAESFLLHGTPQITRLSTKTPSAKRPAVPRRKLFASNSRN